MRFTVLTNLYPPEVLGGYELLARDVVRGLRARGHSVRVLTTGRDERTDDPEVIRSLRLARAFGTDPPGRDRALHRKAALHNRKAVERHLRDAPAPDAVLVMSLRRLGLEAVRTFQRAGIPVVFTVNDDWPASFVASRRHDTLRSLAAWILDRLPPAAHTWRDVSAERVVYLSQNVRREVLDAGAPLPVGRVCSQGVDTTVFAARPFRDISPAPRLLFVGRLHPTKAPDLAIDTLASLRARGVAATLTIAGAAHDPHYERSLREHASRRGCADAIRWLGLVPRDALAGVYADADLFLFVSRWEGEAQALTHLEAIASGVPVVSFPLGGARELYDAHPVIARAARNDGDALADAVLALANDPARQRHLVNAALEMLRTVASLDRYVDVLAEELIASASDRRTTAAAS